MFKIPCLYIQYFKFAFPKAKQWGNCYLNFLYHFLKRSNSFFKYLKYQVTQIMMIYWATQLLTINKSYIVTFSTHFLKKWDKNNSTQEGENEKKKLELSNWDKIPPAGFFRSKFLHNKDMYQTRIIKYSSSDLELPKWPWVKVMTHP